MRRRLGWCGAAVLLLAASACGDGGGTAAEARTARVEGDGRALVPGGEVPAGLHLRTIDRETISYPQNWVALYGDPGLEDPLAGDVVHVVYSVGSETAAGWYEGTAGDETWVRSSLDDDDQEVDSLVVGGRGVTLGELEDLLDRVGVGSPLEGHGDLRPAHLAAEDLHDGRELIAEGPLDFSNAWWTFTGVLRGGPFLQWVSSDLARQLLITTVKADATTSVLIRSMIDDPGGTVVRGTVGALGHPRTVPPEAAPEVLLANWEESGLLVLVQSYGLSQHEVEDFLEGLRLTDESDWATLAREAQGAPPLIESGTELARGTFDGGRWWAALNSSTPSIEVVLRVESVDARLYAEGGVGQCPGSAITRVGDYSDVATLPGSLLAGLSPVGTTRVVIDTTEKPLDVSLQILQGGHGFWTTWLEGDPDLKAIIAYDQDNNEIERLDGDQLRELQVGVSMCVQPDT